MAIWLLHHKEIIYNTTKTFVIQHPEQEDKYLVHGCLEGPESGVYYRGVGVIENNISIVTLPSYVSKLATDLTVNVTPIIDSIESNIPLLAVLNVSNNSFTVKASSPCRFNWVVHGKRENIESEVSKRNVKVEGDGPYKYVSAYKMSEMF